MTDFKKLAENEIAAGLQSLTGWSIENGKLVRE
jgi:hypothetical protein